MTEMAELHMDCLCLSAPADKGYFQTTEVGHMILWIGRTEVELSEMVDQAYQTDCLSFWPRDFPVFETKFLLWE